MRDWKKISKDLVESESGTIMLDHPDMEWGDMPEWVAPYEHPSPQLKVEGNPSPKAIRQFLWEHRNERSLTRDRAFLWKKYDAELETSTVGLGTLTVVPVIERLTNGI